MKANKIQASNDSEINLTPMMDVVFIMLIFFIVTASFVKEKGIGISRNGALAAPTSEQQTAVLKLDRERFTINNQTIALDAIEPTIAQLKASHPELGVHLLSAKDIRIATLVRAIEQVKEAQVNQLTVATF